MTHDEHVDDGREGPSGPRFRRPGRLAPSPGTPQADQVRCACTTCGTHLMAAPRLDGGFEGVCPVCLSRSMAPVPDRRATA